MRYIVMLACLWLVESVRPSSIDNDILLEMQRAQELGSKYKATSLLQVTRETTKTDDLDAAEAKFNPLHSPEPLMRRVNPVLLEEDED